MLFDWSGNIKEIKVPADFNLSIDPVISNWYKYFHNDHLDQFSLHKTLATLQRICEQYNIRDYYISGWTDINFNMIGVDTKKMYPDTCLKLFGGENLLEPDSLTDNLYIYPNVSHPNPAGHIMIAEHLYHWIFKREI